MQIRDANTHDTKARPGRLDTPVQYIKGIGPKRAEILAERGITTVQDLLYYFPFDYLDLTTMMKIENIRREMNSGKLITVIGTVKTFDILGRPPRQRFAIVIGDETGVVQLLFFRSINYFKNAYEVGEMLAVSGKVTSHNNRPQFIHPSIDRISHGGADDEGEGFLHTKGLVPKYGSSEDLRSVSLNVKGLRRIIKTTVESYLDKVEDFLPTQIMHRNKLYPLAAAISSIHFPQSWEEVEGARRRLKFDELFAMQLLLALRRKSIKVELPGIAFSVESKLARHLVDSLPFKLTSAQVSVIKQIADDMKSKTPMNRLLQGDVGSGKTVVALLAMLVAIDNGYQAAFMAPTEILADQHFKTLKHLLGDLEVNVRLLVGSQPARVRADVLEEVKNGSAQLVVGTHALIQEAVAFAKLGLAVIDEQHRFGVEQRAALRGKGGKETPYPDILVMTATPIPRTLSMTLYGDLDVSTIDELPADRHSIKTTVRTDSQRQSVYRFLREQAGKGRQAYVVYPLIEISEKLDLKAAIDGYDRLSREELSDLRIGLIHGRMSSREKDDVMSAFNERKLDILVATTVIEVGIDVPNASVMVIEHAERFGLAQLHQLRGRVGRGTDQSYCILMAPDWVGKLIGRTLPLAMTPDGRQEDLTAVRRLKAMLETSNGFKIADIDLELRGPGDFFGTRQSGLPELHLANLVTDGEILSLARKEALQLIEQDPHLRLAEHQRLRKYFEERMKAALALVEVG